MLERLKDSIVRSGKVAGIELVIESDGRAVYHLVVLERRKSIISTVIKKTGLTDLALVKECVPEQVPVVLSVTGRGVLFKQVATGIGKKELVEQVLPNAQPGDFYISVLEGQAGFVFLARKDRITSYLDELDKAGLSVVNLFLGIAGLSSVVPFISSQESELVTGGYRIMIANERMTTVQLAGGATSEEKSCRVGGEEVQMVLLPAFGAAFGWLAFHTAPEDKEIVEKYQLWREKRVFRRLGAGALVFFASLLFLNLAIFFYLSGENAELGARNSSVLEGIRTVEKLEAEFQQKERFLKEAGWINASKTSFYADQIAASVPATVLLKRLSINPEDVSESRKEKRLIFEAGSILLEGTCKDPVVLNPWLSELKSMDWVTKVVSRKYQYDHKNKTGVFELEISFLH